MAEKPIFDIARAKRKIAQGKRGKWWRRAGSKTRGFYYLTADGRHVADEKHLERIKSLVIPPAWTCVRVVPAASSSLQAQP
jgi:DNA topoisomerase-1